MIKDVIFISRGNETFSRHRVRSLAEGWHVSVLAAFCCLQQSLGLSSKHRHQLTQSLISWWNFFKGMNWNRAKSDYRGSEQEGLCVPVSTYLSDSKKNPWMPPPRVIAAVTRPLGWHWWEDVDKGKTEGWKGKLWEVREIIATAVIASLKCNLLWSLWNRR